MGLKNALLGQNSFVCRGLTVQVIEIYYHWTSENWDAVLEKALQRVQAGLWMMAEIYEATEKDSIVTSDSQKPEKQDSSLLVAAGAYVQALRNTHCFRLKCGWWDNSKSPSQWPGFETTSPGKCLAFLEGIKSTGPMLIKHLESCFPGA